MSLTMESRSAAEEAGGGRSDLPKPGRNGGAGKPGSSEDAQLAQTIEMFEVITESQPLDYQSLEILKEAYSKLGREAEAINTSKRIAQAYVQMGQLSSAILEYETILQHCPDDPDVQGALNQIESRANNYPSDAPAAEAATALKPCPVPAPAAKPLTAPAPREIDDGRRVLHRIFVESKIITAGDFDLCWSTPDLSVPPEGVIEPFIQVLSEKGILPVDKALKVLSDKSRAAYLSLDRYDVDLDLARGFPAPICRRWCILPFDRMGKSVLVATANPFNQQATKDLAGTIANRLLWYLATPAELMKNLRKAFR
jgi:tetratricopeptide (TPR) repeat protein